MKPRMEKVSQFQQILSRAERLLSKESYAAARKEFQRVLRIFPGRNELREKIQVCDQQILLQQRREQIKKARRLEKKGNLAVALDWFTTAFSTQAEPWLQDKITQLRYRLEKGQRDLVVAKTSWKENPEKRLAAYDAALTRGLNQNILEKKASCLVEMGRYEEALSLYADGQMPNSTQGRYDFGYALIACSQYRKGLSQWEPLLEKHPALFPQVVTLLPYLAQELAEQGHGYALAQRILAALKTFLSLKGTPTTQYLNREWIEQYRHYFNDCYLRELWYSGDHEKTLELLPFPHRLQDVPLLAKLYFNLSESNVDYLKAAITYWLTAIYSRDTLSSLQVYQIIPNAPNQEVLRSVLFTLLEERVAVHARADRLSYDMVMYWETEREQIAHFAELLAEPEDAVRPDDPSCLQASSDDYRKYLPCTPAFAREFDLSDKILLLLQEKSDNGELHDRDWLELCANYSPFGQYVHYIEPGDEEEVFASLGDEKTFDRKTEYLRQRIAFQCGVNLVRYGQNQSRRYFQIAIPLLQDRSYLCAELIELVYDPPSEKVISSLSEAMEFLANYLDAPDFLEAAAHCIGLDVQSLIGQDVSLNNLEKRLGVGLAIFPTCAQIRTTLVAFHKERSYRRLKKAFEGSDLSKAAYITRSSEDKEVKEFFFDTIEEIYTDLSFDGKEELPIETSRDLYRVCCFVDENHPVSQRLKSDLSEWE